MMVCPVFRYLFFFLSSFNDLRLLWNQDARKAFSPSQQSRDIDYLF